jgi:hypothetical protein
MRSDIGRYWYSASNRLSLALNSRQAFVTSWRNETGGSPAASLPGVKYPDGLNEFRQGAAIACWLEDPSRWVNRFIEPLGIQIPAERMFISLFQAGSEARGQQSGKYEAMIRMQFSSPSQARGVATLLTLARTFAAGMTLSQMGGTEPLALMTMVFLTNAPVVDGRDITIKSGVLDVSGIALLMQLFSLY